MFSKYYVGYVRFYHMPKYNTCGKSKETINASFDFGFLVGKQEKKLKKKNCLLKIVSI